MYVQKHFGTWFPNTPTEQAVDTWLEPNQMAARRGGMLRRNTWDDATKVCPMKVTQNLSGATDTALIHEPKAVPRAPKNRAHLKPYNKNLFCYMTALRDKVFPPHMRTQETILKHEFEYT